MIEQIFRKTPFLRIGIPYVTGIAGAEFYPLNPLPFGNWISMIVLALIFSLLLWPSHQNILKGTFLSLLFLVSGYFNSSLKSQMPSFPEKGIFSATLLETPIEKPRSFKAEATVFWITGKDSIKYPEENVILYFAKSDGISKLRPGSRIISDARPDFIRNSGNPNSFDYKGFMERRGIRRQIYLSDKHWYQESDDPGPGLIIRAEKTRDRLLAVYRANHLEGNVLEILSALTLGYKKSLDPEVKQVFSNSGAMHVLAVSGLHVGIVFLAFNTVFSFLKRKRMTRVVYLAGALIVLWGYAFLTGLSPSVQRASLMFSLVQVGQSLRRPVNTYNTISASALILLVINPRLIADVGFQLSYAAVLGIVYFQAKMGSLLSSRNRILNYILGLFTVSIAAQIGTAGLSYFYFRQFPVWFWITNLVVIPAALILILFGVSILMFGWIPVISGLLAKVAGRIVETVYELLHWVESLPGAIYTGFGFDGKSLLIYFFVIFAFVMFLESRRPHYVLIMIFLSGLFVFNTSCLDWKFNHQSEIIIYDLPEPTIHVIHGRVNYLIVPDSMKQDAVNGNEILNVVKARNLNRPICIGFNEKFSDRLIMKTGNWIFYGAHKIALPGCTQHEISAISPDLWLRFPYYREDTHTHDSILIITPRYFGDRKDSHFRIHELNREGAYLANSPY